MKRLIFLIILITLIGCSDRLYEVKENRDMMGTFIEITLHHHDKLEAKEAIGAAYLEIERIENVLSNYKDDSEVSILNQQKQITDFSEHLLKNIEKSMDIGEKTDGSFDITVQPILDLYSQSFEKKNRPPTREEISEALKTVDYSDIRIEDDKISIGEDQKITLGGLAKGYAVDKAVEVLKEKGIEHALVNAGGDMKAIGSKYGNTGWNIALANPRDRKDYIEVIHLSDSAIVTSGDYERYFNENKSFHHIVDPNTGYSAGELISVTIKTEDAFDADAISTAVFVMGKEGIELIEEMENVEGLIITEEKEIIRSSGFD